MKRVGAFRAGFTVVELLIVIVVIGILATLTIISYNGVTNSANDAAVKNDIENIAKQAMQFHARNGRYPAGGGGAGVIEGFTIVKAAKGAYDQTVNNLYYCEGNSTFAIAATSKSGKRWAYSPNQSLYEYTGAWGGSTSICPGLGIASYTFSNGFTTTGFVWYSWVQ